MATSGITELLDVLNKLREEEEERNQSQISISIEDQEKAFADLSIDDHCRELFKILPEKAAPMYYAMMRLVKKLSKEDIEAILSLYMIVLVASEQGIGLRTFRNYLFEQKDLLEKEGTQDAT